MHPTPPVPASAPACLNCAAPLLGPFCAACGQRAATPARVTFGALWTDFRVAQLGLDRGFFVTLRDVLRRPGAVARAFVEGRRQVYVHPVAFLFVAYAIYALVFSLVGDALIAGMERAIRLQTSGMALTPAEARAGVAGGASFMRFSVSYGPYLSVLSVLPFAYLLRAFLPRSGRSVAECAVFALTTEAATVTVSGAVVNPLMAWTGAVGVASLSFLLYFGFTALGASAFFDRRPTTLLRASAAQALALVLYMLVLGLASAVYGVVVAMRAAG